MVTLLYSSVFPLIALYIRMFLNKQIKVVIYKIRLFVLDRVFNLYPNVASG